MQRALQRTLWLFLATLLLWCALPMAARGERAPAIAPAAPAAQNGRVIVRYKADSMLVGALSATAASLPQRAQALSRRMGMSLADGPVVAPRTQVIHASGIGSAALAARLSQDSEVEWAMVDARRRATSVPSDPLYGAGQSGTPAVGQWTLRPPGGAVVAAIDAEAAWAITPGSAEVVVAVLDTGVRTDHPDLSGKLYSGRDFVSDAQTANDGDGRDGDASDPGDWVTDAESQLSGGPFEGCGAAASSWHGTQTTGLIGAATDNGVGMASVGRNVMVVPVRVLGKCGGYDSDIVAAMRWAGGLSADGSKANPHPARVINMSLGASGSCSELYRETVSELTAAGVVVVAAAGNDGLAVSSPANCPGVVAVAGVRHTGTKVGYSSLGASVALSAPAGNCVNATGSCLYPLLSTSNTGTTTPLANSYTSGGDDALLGTSFSAPLVSGTLALMFSARPTLTPTQAIDALKSSARAFPGSGADSGVSACRAPTSVAQSSECYCTTSTCGAGLLDAGAALAAVAGISAVIAYSPTAVVAGTAVTLDASGTTVAAGRTVASYLWQVTSGSDIASFTSATNRATATLLPTAAGSVVVSLTATDSAGSQATTSLTLSVAAAASDAGSTSSASTGSGGGAMSWPWLLALGLAVIALRRRPPPAHVLGSMNRPAPLVLAGLLCASLSTSAQPPQGGAIPGAGAPGDTRPSKAPGEPRGAGHREDMLPADPLRLWREELLRQRPTLALDATQAAAYDDFVRDLADAVRFNERRMMRLLTGKGLLVSAVPDIGRDLRLEQNAAADEAAAAADLSARWLDLEQRLTREQREALAQAWGRSRAQAARGPAAEVRP